MSNTINENEKKYASLESLRSFKENADKLYATQENVDEISSTLEEKANTLHTHDISDVTNLESILNTNLETAKSYTDTEVAKKANASHTHTVANISDLTATATELNYMEGVTSNVQTQLNGKTQKISLYGQLQTNAYLTSVIALCKAPTASTSDLNSYSSGRITFQRTNALYAPCFVDITMAAAYGAINRVRTRFMRYGSFKTFKPCTFTYNGVTYGGIEVAVADANASVVVFDGSTSFGIFGLDIYNSNTKTVLNEEVYNSISYDNAIIESGVVDGSGNMITTGNIGSQSVKYATSAGSTSSATKATQDASGNIITSTYATKTELDTAKSSLQSLIDAKPSIDDIPEYITTGAMSGTTIGDCATAEGSDNTASGICSHAEGGANIASGDGSHAEGSDNTASGICSHAEGCDNTASGICSHAEGLENTASGNYSHAGGYGTVANSYQYVIGRYNADTTAPTSISDTTTAAGLFIVGIGSSNSVRSNGFRINPKGKVYGTGTYGTSGADYAEYFEWFDGNPNNEDRRGHFVTLEGDKIRYATPNDDYILGVVSADPSVAGDIHSEDWHNRYLKDVFGSKIVEVVEVEETTDEDGKIIPAHTERRWVLNPDYNPDVKYISREERPEWAAIGIVGKLVVVDDGTCQVNGCCHPNADGIATASQEKTNYRVMERLDDTHIRIFIR